MKYNLGVLSAGGLAGVLLCGPQSVFAACEADEAGNIICNPFGQVAVGAVFSTSNSGARRNVQLALVEELLEDDAEETGGGSGDRMPFDVFATILYRDRDYEGQNFKGKIGTPGFDSDTWGGIIGTTLREDHYFVGAAIDYSQEDTTFKQNAGNQDTDEIGISLYGTYYPLANKNLFVSSAFRYGDRDIDTSRNVRGDIFINGVKTPFDGGIARGSTNGKTYSLLGGAGYSWSLQERTLVALSGWLDWNRNNTDGYTESGSKSNGNLRFEDDDYSTFDGILTATLLHSIPITNGRVIPSLSLNYVHEFESDTRTIRAELDSIFDPANPDNQETFFNFRTNEADKDYFRINASVDVELNQGVTLYASYTGTLGHDWRNENLFAIGVSVLF